MLYLNIVADLVKVDDALLPHFSRKPKKKFFQDTLFLTFDCYATSRGENSELMSVGNKTWKSSDGETYMLTIDPY